MILIIFFNDTRNWTKGYIQGEVLKITVEHIPYSHEGKGKGKGKFHPRTSHEGPGGE
jgi:hypothetical protein